MDTTHLIQGIHHVTATVSNAQADYDFYTQLLGLRLVKKTVNFDNNKVYHFYYGTAEGAPGTIMTTFPYAGQGIRVGIPGTGQVSRTGFSAPSASLLFWKERLTAAGVSAQLVDRFGRVHLQFKDPSGLGLEIIGTNDDPRSPWRREDISLEMALRGIFNVSVAVKELVPTLDFLTTEFGFQLNEQSGNISRFQAKDGGAGQYIDVMEEPDGVRGKNGMGIVHHVAWRLDSEAELAALRERLVHDLGFKVTEIKDRKYFQSIYFRIPGGVLFEVATIPPGFGVDEEETTLGQHLQLPTWEEENRAQIEANLEQLDW
ncbi:MAG: ring-cleaving dioxygenase [Saprospiraceae bacterium]|nr:ring-cleaving dioxygenase [Saprospiraceae bacterium]